MSTYILMRILESSAERYEFGIRLITLGSLEMAYGRLATHIASGQQVLDLGCGTGALTLRAARRGAHVKGIDINSQMLEIAEQRVKNAGLSDSVDLVEMGVAELDREQTHSYDVVMSGLCFSELSDNELSYTFRQLSRILRPGGLMLIADETLPQGLLNRAIHLLIRLPLVILTYLITQQTTHPISNLIKKLEAAEFRVKSIRTNRLDSFAEIVAQTPNNTT